MLRALLLPVVATASLATPAPVAAQDRRPVRPDSAARLEARLAELEAQVRELSELSSGATEVGLYHRVRRAVVQVNSGLSHGSGFLIQGRDGWLVTNEHVLEPGQTLTATLDSSTRVSAQVLARDRKADLAVLRIHPQACTDCPRLPLASRNELADIAASGSRVVAIGYPLSIGASITSGIVSGVRGGAVLSDVNLNSGNSGGPLLTLAGTVIGVNTFVQRGRAGTGVSGAITVTELLPILERATRAADTLPVPSAERLPMLNVVNFPLDLLRQTATAVSERAHRPYSISSSHFRVFMSTPVSQLAYIQRREQELGSFLARRTARGDTLGRGDTEVVLYTNWQQYIGDETRPAVTIVVLPQYFAFGSTPRVQSTYVRRNGVRMTPVMGGLDDDGDAMYVLRPEVFRPSPQALAPRIELVISDATHGRLDTLPDVVELPPAAVARAWNDFEAYYAFTGELDFRRSEPTVAGDAGEGIEVSGAMAELTNATFGALDETGYRTTDTFYTNSETTWFATGNENRIRITLRIRGRRATVHVLSDLPETAQAILTSIRRQLPER